MSLLTHVYIVEKYGPLLTEEHVGAILHLAAGTVKNQRVKGEFPIPHTKRGGAILFHAADVADYVDSMRKARS